MIDNHTMKLNIQNMYVPTKITVVLEKLPQFWENLPGNTTRNGTVHSQL